MNADARQPLLLDLLTILDWLTILDLLTILDWLTILDLLTVLDRLTVIGSPGAHRRHF
ncbi:hypothetical protein [Paraburkholderia hospita]|jgi:hypothetical protein|uniref:hypothetical protein n=1 Tax=Paraburkholderia hospita TaxID=169430 RepID=UPI00141E3687|nr:hypothetical protein [Paraburkholderia hospita]